MKLKRQALDIEILCLSFIKEEISVGIYLFYFLLLCNDSCWVVIVDLFFSVSLCLFLVFCSTVDWTLWRDFSRRGLAGLFAWAGFKQDPHYRCEPPAPDSFFSFDHFFSYNHFPLFPHHLPSFYNTVTSTQKVLLLKSNNSIFGPTNELKTG